MTSCRRLLRLNCSTTSERLVPSKTRRRCIHAVAAVTSACSGGASDFEVTVTCCPAPTYTPDPLPSGDERPGGNSGGARTMSGCLCLFGIAAVLGAAPELSAGRAGPELSGCASEYTTPPPSSTVTVVPV